jgi:hypothetical protein
MARLGIFTTKCNRCDDEELFYVLRRTTWVTVFHLPVIPYNIEYFVVCTSCGKDHYVDKNEMKIIMGYVKEDKKGNKAAS